VLTATSNRGDEAVIPKQGDRIVDELGGTVHDAPPLVRTEASAATGATASTVGVGSTGRGAIRCRRGGGSGNGVVITCSITQSGT